MSQRETWPGEGEGPPVEEDEVEVEAEEAEDPQDTGDELQLRVAHEHAEGELDVPDDIDLLEGEARDTKRGVGIVVSRFNGEIVNRLLASALAALEKAEVAKDSITVMAVPGAFELPLGAMALAKTRRYSCIVALGCVIRGETAHFEYISGEAASGLQLAALETGVPVSFGVLTVDTVEQAEARIDKGGEAVRTALEMADLFSQLRSTAQAS
jgi:6,7-dimethyl-8-ribityllumazine synthase